MKTIESRLQALKGMGAGDKTCEQCLEMGVPDMDVCRQCIKDAPSFTAALKRFMAESKVSKEKTERAVEEMYEAMRGLKVGDSGSHPPKP